MTNTTTDKKQLHDLSAEIDRLFNLGRCAEGELRLREALEISSCDRIYHLFFQAEAAGYLEGAPLKQRDLILEAYRGAAADPFIVRSLGIWHLAYYDERKAMKYFDDALSLDPADWEAARSKGICYSHAGREQAAMQWYARSMAFNPLDSDAMRQTGVSLSKLGRNRESIEWYRRCLLVNAEDYDAMRQLGISLALTGDYQEALSYLNQALAINPKDRETTRNLRLVLQKANGEEGTFLERLLVQCGRKVGVWYRVMFSNICR